MEKIRINEVQLNVAAMSVKTDGKKEIFPKQRSKSRQLHEKCASGKNFEVYKKQEGLYQAKIYNEQINYFDEVKKGYRPCNNQLRRMKQVRESVDFVGYENIAGDYKVRLSEDLSCGIIYAIKKGKYVVKFLTDNACTCKAKIEEKNNVQKLLYQDFIKGVDLEYGIGAGILKENIIVKEKGTGKEFAFILKTQNLDMQLSQDGKVLNFLEKNGEEVIFKIPAPSMTDGSGNRSDEVWYDITKRSSDTYLFKVVVSSEWMDAPERIYPVKIDPTIMNSLEKDYIETYTLKKLDEYDGSLDSTTHYVNIVCGSNNNYVTKIWVKFNLEGVIPENSIIRSAVLHMEKLSFYYSDKLMSYNEAIGKVSDVSVHQITSMNGKEASWIGKLTEKKCMDILDCRVESGGTEFTVNVTDVIKDQDKCSKGILFEMAKTTTDSHDLTIASAFTSEPSYMKPYLEVEYYIPEEFSAGEKYSAVINERCTYALNMYTGTELIEYKDIEMTGNRLPLQISHVYNSLYKDKDYFTKEKGVKTNLPHGWKLNVQQYLYSEGSGEEKKYVYVDQLGYRHNLTRHLKVKATPSGSSYTFDVENYEYRDDSIGMKLIALNQLMDNAGTVYEFSSSFLTKIIDKNGNTVSMTYGADEDCNYVLQKITDGSGREAVLNYESGYLSSIDLPDGTQINYENLNNTIEQLQEIVQPDGTKVWFIYSSDSICKIKDNTGYNLQINRFDNNTRFELKDGTTVRKITGNGAEEFCETSADDEIQVLGDVFIREGYAIVAQENGIKTYYKFNDKGDCINKFSIYGETSPNILAYEGSRQDENVVYQFGNIANAENLFEESPNLNNWSTKVNAQEGNVIALIGKMGEDAYIERNISVTSLPELRDDEGISLMALVRADEVCLNPSELSAAKFQMKVKLAYTSGTEKERIFYFDGSICNDYQLGCVPLSKDELNGLNSLSVRIDYSRCYNREKDDVSLSEGLPQSMLSIRAVRFERCKLTKTLFAPTFYDGDIISSAQEINRIYYGSTSYEVNAKDAGSLLAFSNDIANMLANPGTIFKDGEIIEQNVDLSTIKLRGYGSNTQYNNRYLEKNLFSLDYAPRGYMESVGIRGTSRSWSDSQNWARRSSFINKKSEEFCAFYAYDENGNLVSIKNEKPEQVTSYEYNSYGTVKKETLDAAGTGKYIYESETDTNGCYTVKEYDERYSMVDSSDNITELYTHSQYENHRLKKVTMPNGQAYNYGYSVNGLLSSVSAGYTTRQGNSVSHIQNENIQYEYKDGLLTKINRTDSVYEFEYDGYSRVTKVTLNGVEVYSAAYNRSGDGKSYTTVAYGNGWSGEEESDSFGRFVKKSVIHNGTEQIIASAEYDEATMLLKKLTDNGCGSGKSTQISYEYDEHGEVSSVRYTGYRTGTYTQETDSEGYMTKSVYEKGIGDKQEYRYLYEVYNEESGNHVPNAKVTRVYLPTGKKVKYVYDKLNRITERGIVTDTDEYYSEKYHYERGGYHEKTVQGYLCGSTETTIETDRATTFVSEVEFRGLNLTDKYEYDANGNIIRRTTGGKEIRYTYDDIDRLVREDNAALNKTYFYEYDDFGNIEKVTSYNYTTGNSLTGEVTRTYAYDVDKRLTSVTENGVTQSISGYDALGNPSSYKGKTLTWTRGRMLASCGSDSYLYDMDGVRQEKTVNGVTHTYYTDGTKIIAEKVGDKVFEYYYDAQGIIGFKYDGNVYYYKKNLQGDIDRIYDANKNLVAEYKYDAWGNHRIYSGEGLDITENATYNNSVAKVNPFRYRGYYYDAETGLYYLNSRYYDPSIGRFINADDISYIQPMDVNGLNLFAYCGNNPVMYIDPDGTLFWFFIGAILIGAAIGGTMNGISAYNEGQRGWGLFGAIAGGAVMGGAMGGVLSLGGVAGLASTGLISFGLSTGAAFGISLGVGAAAGMISYSLENGLRTDREWSVGGMFMAGVAGLIKGATTFGFGYLGGKYGAFDKLALKGLLGKELVKDSVSYGIAKGLLSAAMPSFLRNLFTWSSFYLGETLTKLLFISSVASGTRWLIDRIFGL